MKLPQNWKFVKVFFYEKPLCSSLNGQIEGGLAIPCSPEKSVKDFGFSYFACTDSPGEISQREYGGHKARAAGTTSLVKNASHNHVKIVETCSASISSQKCYKPGEKCRGL